MYANQLITLLIMLCSLGACKKDKVQKGGEWLIPKNEVKDGGPGKDGIPALENPAFTDPSGATYLTDNNLVIGFISGSVIKAYPHRILDWHEIINDNVNGKKIAITYCPLTGTGIGWNRVVNGTTTTFGVSGVLYNSNLIPYDRATDSNWSQMRLDCVNGELISEKVETYQVVETTWKTWKEMYPSTKVVSENTGHNRNYGAYPYGDYITNNSKLLFPVNNEDSRLPNKERAHGILINSKAKVYSIEEFKDSVKVVEDNFGAIPLVIAGSKSENIIVSFNSKLKNGTLLTFAAVQDSLPIIMKDNEGTRWDVFGKGVSGPRAGEQLTATTSFMGYWFAWAAFYPSAEIYE
ncbi:MAG: hypothetical protein COA57_02165 [Flavobacteriales bacterium]|nr:DUF3179 domain-containing protein [Bacteroidales bacterium AH-315-I05]PCJ89425.1 MAG: hypothetical protein COA57_02165 [Flavobacteriales bacterium]